MIENKFINQKNIDWVCKCIDRENTSPTNWSERSNFCGAAIRDRIMDGIDFHSQDPWIAANIAVASLNPDEKGDLYKKFLELLTQSTRRESIHTISNLLTDGLHLLEEEEQIPISENSSNEVLKFCIHKICKLSEGGEEKSKFRLGAICSSLLELGFINPSFYTHLKNAGGNELSRYQMLDEVRSLELKYLNEHDLNLDPSKPEDIHKLDKSMNLSWLANPFCDQDLVDTYFHIVTDEFQAGTGGNVWAASNYLIHNPNISKDKIIKIIGNNDFSMSSAKNRIWPMSHFRNLSEDEVYDYISMNKGVLSVKAIPPQNRALALARLLQEAIDSEDYDEAISLMYACSGTPILGMLNPSMRLNVLRLTYTPEASHVGVMLSDLSIDALQIIELSLSGLNESSISQKLDISEKELKDLMSMIFTECAIRLSKDDAYLSGYGLTQFLASGLISLSDPFHGTAEQIELSIADHLMKSNVDPELMESLISASLSASTKSVGLPIKAQRRCNSL